MKELEVTAAGGGGEKPNSGLCLDATELCDAHVYPTYLISLLYMKKDAHGTTIHA